MRTCCCSLAGTRACVGCSNNTWQEYDPFPMDNTIYKFAKSELAPWDVLRELIDRIMKLEQPPAQPVTTKAALMLYCPDCRASGTPINENDRVCGNCGKSNARLFREIPKED